MNLPTVAECEQLFTTYHVPPNFLWHCQKVAEVGTFLARELQKKGININIDLVQRACLLHDLFKFVTLPELKEQPEFNASAPTAEQLASWKQLKEEFPDLFEGQIFHALFKEQWPELAEQLRVASDPYRVIALGKDRPWEERIQHYADCRVLSDTVVTLSHRFEDADKRYPQLYQAMGDKRAQEKEKIYEDEAEIFSIIGVSPDILLEFNNNKNDLTIKTYNRHSEAYYEGTKHYKDHHIYLTDNDIQSGQQVLDAGCAYGRDAHLLSQQGAVVTGIDRSENLIAKAKQLYPTLDFSVMDIRKITFPPSYFDHIICNAVLLHLEKKEIPSVLASFYQLLKPGGKLWLGVKKGEQESYELRSGTLKYVSKFSNQEIRAALAQAGFIILKQYDNKEQRKNEEIIWIDVVAQKPLKKEGGE